MNRILLVSANPAVDPYPVYPLGMAVIANVLTDAGYDVEQFDVRPGLLSTDQENFDDLRRRIQEHNPMLVGISIRNVDDVDSLNPDTLHVNLAQQAIEVARECTDAPVVLGGPGFSLLPEAILEHTGADSGVVGEGETIMVHIADAVRDGKPLERLYQSESKLQGAGIYGGRYDERIVRRYLDDSGILNIQTKRGCPFTCIYCSYPTLEGRKLRCREPEQVAEELVVLGRDHGVEHVFFTDSVFNDPQGQWLDIARELVKQGNTVKWSAFIMPSGRGGSYIGRPEMKILKESGLHAMEIGTDASTDATLKGLGKHFTFADALHLDDICVEADVPSSHYVIFGGPGETAETLEQGITNVLKLSRSVIFPFLGIRIYPGTPLFQIALDEGVLCGDENLLMSHYYFAPGFDSDRAHKVLLAAFKGRRNIIYPPSQGQERVAVMRRFGFRGLLWDNLVPDRNTRDAGAKARTLPGMPHVANLEV